MKVSEIGEFGLIKHLARMADKAGDAEKEAWRRLIVGIGDDATAYRVDNSIQLATVDSLVENIHFSLSYTKWEELGWKSLAVNLSDIAAMGGLPHYALVSLGLPENTEVEDIIAMYRGMLEMAKQYGVVVVGGDTVRSPFIFISITVMGSSAGNNNLLRRSSAKPGDKIAVTNNLGASAAGLEMLSQNLKFKPKLMAQLRQAHLKPVPRIAEGRLLVEKGVKCGMDISDGLVGDLTHICEQSKVGARIDIDLVPVSPAVQECFGERALEFALRGGEDYELLFTASETIMNRVKKAIQCPVTVIGEITAGNAGKVKLVDSQGTTINLKKKGWDHFAIEERNSPFVKGDRGGF